MLKSQSIFADNLNVIALGLELQGLLYLASVVLCSPSITAFIANNYVVAFL